MLSKFFITVSSFTLLSRSLGFVRDILFAAFLGTGPLAQAFLVALKLPNFFRRLFAEGAFNAAFVPMFSDKLEISGKEQAKKFAENIFAIMLVALIIFTIIFELFMPYILYVIAPGFTGDEALFDLAVTLTRISFPYLLLISVATIFAGILNSNDKFAAIAVMPVLFNLSLIGFLTIGSKYFATSSHALSWGVFVAGVLQLVWALYNLKKIDFIVRFKFSNLKISNETKVFFKKFAPGAIGAGVTQINLWIDVVIATFFSGAVAFLYYADRVNQLPLSIIGTAMGTALLPTLSKNIAAKNFKEANENYNKSVLTILFLTIPATAAFLSISEPLIEILFQRGEFNSEATKASAKALMVYSLGLPAFALIKIFASCFFALKNTKIPVYSAIYSLIINVVLNIFLVIYFQSIGIYPHLGLAFATSIAGWFNAIYLYFALKSKSDFKLDSILIAKYLKITISAAIMGVIIYYVFSQLENTPFNLIIVVILGLIIYFTLTIILKTITISDAKRIFKRGS